MQKKNIKKFNVKQSIFMLLLLAVFLVLSTYAWFTSNTLVKIESIEVSVETSAGFQISVDAVNWKSVISPTDIIDRTGARNVWNDAVDPANRHQNHIPSSLLKEMKPVSTIADTDTDGTLKMFLGEVDVDQATGELALTAERSIDDEDNRDYIAFDLFLKTSQAMDIYLDVDSNVKGGLNTALTTKGLENSVRVGFVVQGHKTFTEYEASGGIAATRNMKDAEQVIFWEPNSDSHTVAAINDANNSWGKNITPYQVVSSYSGIKDEISTTPIKLINANFTSNASYFGEVVAPGTPEMYPEWNIIKTPKPLADAVTNPTWQQGEDDYYKNTGNDGLLANPVKLGIKLEEGITKVRVYMWIEGQDYDCQDFASRNRFSI